LQFYPHNYLRGVIAKLIFGGKDKPGNGYTRRASAELSIFPRQNFTGVSSILRWRTLILVIPEN
jgi:hypothetical protein